MPRINVPLLIIQGDADRILPFPATGKRLHEAVAGSRLVVLAGAPHGIPWTHADAINRALLDFLGEDRSAAAIQMPGATINLPAGVEAMGDQEAPDTRPPA
jgi:fermentation-respiration switch protein FrsA (DUF1100 family)